MANRFTDAVFETRQIAGLNKLVLLMIARHADKKGSMWTGVPTLAAECGISERTVQRAIELCEERKIIAKIGRKNHGRGHYTNIWQINLEALKFQGEDDSPGDSQTPGQLDGVTNSPKPGDSQSQAGCPTVMQTLHDGWNTTKGEHDKDGMNEWDGMDAPASPSKQGRDFLDKIGLLLECPSSQYKAVDQFIHDCESHGYDPVDVYLTQPLIVKKESLLWGCDFEQAVRSMTSDSPKSYPVRYAAAVRHKKNWAHENGTPDSADPPHNGFEITEDELA
jgi:hypothetical protein